MFCEEQGCSVENEIDADDARSWHFVAYTEVGKPLAVLRVVPPPFEHHDHNKQKQQRQLDPKYNLPLEPQHSPKESLASPYVKLGRFATLAPYRGKRIGQALVAYTFAFLQAHASDVLPAGSPGGLDVWTGTMNMNILIHAQEGVIGMWGKLGFEVDEEMGRWVEERIVHVGMWKSLTLSLNSDLRLRLN